MIFETELTRVGYRVTDEQDVGRYTADFVQISLYYGAPRAVERMLGTVRACRSARLPYVIHPIEYYLSRTDDEPAAGITEDLRIMAQNADLGLIVHDETMPGGSRLTGEHDATYRRELEELKRICPVSIENSSNSHDIQWFWSEYASSATLDIGHLEAAHIDSARFVTQHAPQLREKLDFVHIHHVAGLRKGLTDHWGLVEGCRELHTLERLLAIKKNCGVIVEIIEEDDVQRSLDLVRNIAGR